MTGERGKLTPEQMLLDLQERKGCQKMREAATLIAESGVQLGKATKPEQRWYDCNRLHRGVIDWLDRWEPAEVREQDRVRR